MEHSSSGLDIPQAGCKTSASESTCNIAKDYRQVFLENEQAFTMKIGGGKWKSGTLVPRDGSLRFFVELSSTKKRVKIEVDCEIPFILQLNSEGLQHKSEAVSSFDNQKKMFHLSGLSVTVGSEVNYLFFEMKAIGWQSNPPKTEAKVRVMIRNAVIEGIQHLLSLKHSLGSPSHVRTKSLPFINVSSFPDGSKRKSVTFNNTPEVFNVSVSHPTPPNPKKIKKSCMKNRELLNIKLSEAQQAEVKQKIRSMTEKQHLTYGDLLILAIGKYTSSCPPFAEEFFEWIDEREWIHFDTLKKINTFSLMTDRSWLKSIVEGMYQVQINYGAGDLGL